MNISEKNYLESGYTGLTNLGNTCFLNSCVQILTHTLDLHKIFNNKAVLTRMETNKKMEGNEKLDQLLSEVISSSETAKSLAEKMGVSTEDKPSE